jgi:hypothetical protein
MIDVPDALDTDCLGTFTGEVPRPGTAEQIVVAKARLGMARTGQSLGLATEGSFGPHPVVPFIAAARELIALIDDERGIIVRESLMSTNTNFGNLILRPEEPIDSFLTQIAFPAHAVIVRPNIGPGQTHKGITDRELLQILLNDSAHDSEDGQARLETDMRAHFNPTRMIEIGKLATKLAQRLKTLCPACGTPGFGTVRTVPGLTCKDCGTDTQMIRSIISGCVACDYEVEGPRSDGRTHATPAECPECNP